MLLWQQRGARLGQEEIVAANQKKDEGEENRNTSVYKLFMKLLLDHLNNGLKKKNPTVMRSAHREDIW